LFVPRKKGLAAASDDCGRIVGNPYLGIISRFSVAQNQVMEAMLKPGLVN
jgi:hypothetical protein